MAENKQKKQVMIWISRDTQALLFRKKAEFILQNGKSISFNDIIKAGVQNAC